jgi:hypothetical protein
MPVGDKCWLDYSVALRKRMFAEGRFEITVPIDEIHRESRTDVTISELRKSGYWNMCRDAKPYWDTFQKNGIELDFEVEADGNVHFVTFRLDGRRRGTLERNLKRQAEGIE